MILALLAAFLGARGYSVESAPDGEAALALVRELDFNLLITDRNMPRMDGVELCRAVRAETTAAYVYCIMLTSQSEADSLVEAMEAGVDDFLAKPLQLPELGARLHAAERVLALEADLENRNRRLGEAYSQLSRDLELARAVQLSQLPAPAQLARVRFEWLFEASSFVGGDTLDYFALDEERSAFYLLDVSGHGVAAAMIAFNAQHQLRACSHQVALATLARKRDLGAAAVAVAAEFNRRFLQMQDTQLYLTMVYGLVDAESRRVAFVQAGHPPPLFKPAGASAFEPVGEGGLPVGILADAAYEAHALPLEAGARLLVYSDGITECANAGGDAFGEARLKAALEAEAASLAGTCAGLRAALQAWRGPRPLEDDITALALEAR